VLEEVRNIADTGDIGVYLLVLFSAVDCSGTNTDPELEQSQDGDDQWHILVHAAEQVSLTSMPLSVWCHVIVLRLAVSS
jgi:hypothetical protein